MEYRLQYLIEMIDEPNRSLCLKLYTDNKYIFDTSKGSNTKHQAWEGGYIDHITEVMNISIKQYDMMSFRELPFSLSDALLVLFLHDLEKPWKYGGDVISDSDFELLRFGNKEFVKSKIDEYGFILTKEHLNALEYVHGEGSDYNPNTRVQGELAAFVHVCDVISARIWYDYPIK